MRPQKHSIDLRFTPSSETFACFALNRQSRSKDALPSRRGNAPGRAEQGNAACNPYPTQAILSMACLGTRLQVTPSLLRCRVFQPVGQKHTHRQGTTATKGADSGTG